MVKLTFVLLALISIKNISARRQQELEEIRRWTIGQNGNTKKRLNVLENLRTRVENNIFKSMNNYKYTRKLFEILKYRDDKLDELRLEANKIIDSYNSVKADLRKSIKEFERLMEIESKTMDILKVLNLKAGDKRRMSMRLGRNYEIRDARELQDAHNNVRKRLSDPRLKASEKKWNALDRDLPSIVIGINELFNGQIYRLGETNRQLLSNFIKEIDAKTKETRDKAKRERMVIVFDKIDDNREPTLLKEPDMDGNRERESSSKHPATSPTPTTNTTTTGGTSTAGDAPKSGPAPRVPSVEVVEPSAPPQESTREDEDQKDTFVEFSPAEVEESKRSADAEQSRKNVHASPAGGLVSRFSNFLYKTMVGGEETQEAPTPNGTSATRGETRQEERKRQHDSIATHQGSPKSRRNSTSSEYETAESQDEGEGRGNGTATERAIGPGHELSFTPTQEQLRLDTLEKLALAHKKRSEYSEVAKRIDESPPASHLTDAQAEVFRNVTAFNHNRELLELTVPQLERIAEILARGLDAVNFEKTYDEMVRIEGDLEKVFRYNKEIMKQLGVAGNYVAGTSSSKTLEGGAHLGAPGTDGTAREGSNGSNTELKVPLTLGESAGSTHESHARAGGPMSEDTVTREELDHSIRILENLVNRKRREFTLLRNKIRQKLDGYGGFTEAERAFLRGNDVALEERMDALAEVYGKLRALATKLKGRVTNAQVQELSAEYKTIKLNSLKTLQYNGETLVKVLKAGDGVQFSNRSSLEGPDEGRDGPGERVTGAQLREKAKSVEALVAKKRSKMTQLLSRIEDSLLNNRANLSEEGAKFMRSYYEGLNDKVGAMDMLNGILGHIKKQLESQVGEKEAREWNAELNTMRLEVNKLSEIGPSTLEKLGVSSGPVDTTWKSTERKSREEAADLGKLADSKIYEFIVLNNKIADKLDKGGNAFTPEERALLQDSAATLGENVEKLQKIQRRLGEVTKQLRPARSLDDPEAKKWSLEIAGLRTKVDEITEVNTEKLDELMKRGEGFRIIIYEAIAHLYRTFKQAVKKIHTSETATTTTTTSSSSSGPDDPKTTTGTTTTSGGSDEVPFEESHFVNVEVPDQFQLRARTLSLLKFIHTRSDEYTRAYDSAHGKLETSDLPPSEKQFYAENLRTLKHNNAVLKSLIQQLAATVRELEWPVDEADFELKLTEVGEAEGSANLALSYNKKVLDKLREAGIYSPPDSNTTSTTEGGDGPGQDSHANAVPAEERWEGDEKERKERKRLYKRIVALEKSVSIKRYEFALLNNKVAETLSESVDLPEDELNFLRESGTILRKKVHALDRVNKGLRYMMTKLETKEAGALLGKFSTDYETLKGSAEKVLDPAPTSLEDLERRAKGKRREPIAIKPATSTNTTTIEGSGDHQIPGTQPTTSSSTTSSTTDSSTNNNGEKSLKASTRTDGTKAEPEKKSEKQLRFEAYRDQRRMALKKSRKEVAELEAKLELEKADGFKTTFVALAILANVVLFLN